MNLAPFKELLLRTCGHCFENEREQALSAALCCRMAARSIEDHTAYLTLLSRDSDELLRLTELLTVNETYFFREPDHLNLMVDTLIPELVAARNGRPVKILSAGCSTGEEPYSVAILLRERFGAESERMFAITGVDIDSTVIETARQGVYGRSSFRGMDESLLERYFQPAAQGRFQISDTVRKQVGFEVVNLLGVSYPYRMQLPDIILYRNVSIYFPGQIQREIFANLAELLALGGCLLVGASETIHHDVGILSLVKQDSLFFYRKFPALVFEERRTASRHSSTSARGAGGGGHAAASKRPETRHVRRSGERPGSPPVQSPAPRDAGACFDEALALAHRQEHDKALALLDVIIARDNTFEKAYSLKGSLLLSISRFDEAGSVCEALLERNPFCLEAYLMHGMIARQNGDDEDALRRFREAIYLDPACWLAHFYTAELLYMQQEGKRARGSYEAALKILEKGTPREHGMAFFPLSFNAEQFIVICRHKLSLLAASRG